MPTTTPPTAPPTVAEKLGNLHARLDSLSHLDALANAAGPGDADSPAADLRAIAPRATDGGAALALARDAIAFSTAVSTTLIRTYQGLRIVMLGAAPAIFLAVFLVWSHVRGFQSLPSLSHYYYTPAGVVFVGALVTAAAALLAISGAGAERTLLDIAAFFCPLIAIIPTPLSPDEVSELGLQSCSPSPCIPAPFDGYVDIGITVWFTAVITALLLGGVSAVRAWRQSGRFPWPAGAAIIAVAGLLVAFVIVRITIPGVFAHYAHVASACTFLLLLAVVALIQGIRPPYRSPQQQANDEPPTTTQRVLRWVCLALGILMFLVFVPVVLILFGAIPPTSPFPTVVLWVEVASLSLFSAFWLIQTLRKWVDPDV